MDAEEYEYVMSDFGVPPKDAKNAFLMFSQVQDIVRVILTLKLLLLTTFCAVSI